MGGQNTKQEKEEIVIAQNAAGGEGNSAVIQEFQSHMSTIKIFVGIVCIIIILVAGVLAYRQYRKCHQKWIQRELRAEIVEGLRHRMSWRRRLEPVDEESGK